jgi:5,10-methylenetetrahydromethanopterin reductase
LGGEFQWQTSRCRILESGSRELAEGARHMEFGVSYPSSFQAVEQAVLAEELGFDTIGFYDSPALEPDVWITIANAVQATRRIRVGTEVLIPHLRHPMAQAAAIATIERLAPGRLYIGIGTGFTGRMAMGQRPLTWSYMRQFLIAIRTLLAGDPVEIDGRVAQMRHPPPFAPDRPIKVPFIVAANGPKGVEVARELGDGLIYGGDPSKVPSGFDTLWMPAAAIVLDQGEPKSSPQVQDTARIMFSLQYHLAYEGFSNPPVLVQQLPYGDDWLATLEALPADVRHLAVHDQHTVSINDHDREFIDRHPDALADFVDKVAITSKQLRENIERLGSLGMTHANGPALAGEHWEWATRTFAKGCGL